MKEGFIMVTKEFLCKLCNCKKEADDSNPPKCCGKEMKPLDNCNTAVSDPEQARSDDFADACNDGTRRP